MREARLFCQIPSIGVGTRLPPTAIRRAAGTQRHGRPEDTLPLDSDANPPASTDGRGPLGESLTTS